MMRMSCCRLHGVTTVVCLILMSVSAVTTMSSSTTAIHVASSAGGGMDSGGGRGGTTKSSMRTTGNSDRLRSRTGDPSSMGRRRTQRHCTIDGMFCVPANYSKYVPPLDKKYSRPMDISIGFDNFEILKIDDRDFTVEINAYLIVKWKDSRVIINKMRGSSGFLANPNETEWIPVELELVDRIWLPDTEILRLKGFHSLSVLDRLQGLWMSYEYEVLYVVATRIRFMCPMNFASFPMDSHTCKFQVGSFNYDNTKMRYKTYFHPTLPNSTDPILDYEVKVLPLHWTETYYLPQETGNYSVAGFRLYMERKVSHYVITYYLPSALFVVVSWASFLIPSDDIQGRMALLVTLFLVLVNIFNAITTNSPKADGLNALQAWVLTCIFFVFGALLEYSLILLHLKIYSVMQGIPEHMTTANLGRGLIMATANLMPPMPPVHSSTLPSGGGGGVGVANGNRKNSASSATNARRRLSIPTALPRPPPLPRPATSNQVPPHVAQAKMQRKNQMVAKCDLVCLICFPVVFLLFGTIYLAALYI